MYLGTLGILLTFSRSLHRYGFLSENAGFASKVEKAGMAFIGPSPEVIDSLGDKTKARALAIKTGVPVVPGTVGAVESYDLAADFIKDVGFPGVFILSISCPISRHATRRSCSSPPFPSDHQGGVRRRRAWYACRS